MPLGALNPMPLRLGGGPAHSERAYTTIRHAVGAGGSAENDLGIDGLWRRSRAKGLAAGNSSKRRALLQAFPHLATDALSYYERILGLVADGNETERRARVVPLWTRRPIRNTGELEASLQAIDARFSLVESPHESASTTQFGRAFAPYEVGLEAPPFGIAAGHSQFPNYSSDMIVRVLFDVGYDGPVRASDLRLVETARRLLRTSLSSWVDWSIAVGPWKLGTTPIGFGAL